MKYSNDELLLMDPVEVYKLRLNGTISRFPKGFFQEQGYIHYNVAAKITKYLIEEKLKWSFDEVCSHICQKTFFDNNLRGMLDRIFYSSPFAALDNAYPGKYKPWQLHYVPQNYWNKETAKEATIWLIEEKLNWSFNEVCSNICQKTFYDNGLTGMISNFFYGSPFEALENAYPGKYKPWQLSNIPLNYWNKETAKEATIWLIEEKLNWSFNEVCSNICQKTFYDNKLRIMLDSTFNCSPFAALDNAYPGKYKPWQLIQTPRNYWNKETAKEATIWLIEEKLNWSFDEICTNICKKTFYNNKLRKMLDSVFNSSPYAALENAYPGKFKKIGRKIILA